MVCPDGRPERLRARAFDRAAQRATTQDFLTAIGNAKPTLTPEMIEEFLAETDRFNRA